MRLSGSTLNSVSGDESVDQGLLQYDVLDLLSNGPSSFAALYGQHLVRLCGYSDLEVSRAIGALVQMEQRGWVKAWQMADHGTFHEPTDAERQSARVSYETWLPSAHFEELPFDKTGLWYEMTPEGRIAWNTWSGGETGGRGWALYDDALARTIVVHAKSLEAAEEALQSWLAYNSTVELVEGTKTVESVSDFALRDGTVVRDALKIVWSYKPKDGNVDLASTSNR